MRVCSVCKIKYQKGNGTLFHVPKDVGERTKWSRNCGTNLAASALICGKHFLQSSIIYAGTKAFLISNAEPLVEKWQRTHWLDQESCLWKGPINKPSLSLPNWEQQHLIMQQQKEQESPTGKNADISAPINSENVVFDNPKTVLSPNLLNSNIDVIPPQLQEEPIMQIPVIKTVSCSGYTQTNTRLCGLVQVSDLTDEFRFNCFYCSTIFPLEKWNEFTNHLKNKHFEIEEAFKTAKYVSKDHDYTPICSPPSTPIEDALETVVLNAKSLLPFLADPLESTHHPFESVILNPSVYYTQDENKEVSKNTYISNNFITPNREADISVMKNKLESAKENLMQSSESSVLNPCLKDPNVDDMVLEVKQDGIRNLQKLPTEISFEYTPPDVINFLLDNMKNYPVLWQFDDEPFNEDFYEAVEDLCKIVNDKWSLNIDNLKMRRSINRILRFYCYLLPNANVENDQFTCYFNKCAAFLPLSSNEIAYARCSHCYICYKNDFDLKCHLSEEQKYLQWPYKCVQCKECFREIDEYEFHRHMPHYDETFRCQPCNQTFFHRNMYTRHIIVDHPKGGKYKCNICDKAFQTTSGLKYHKIIHGERKHKCHICSKTFFRNATLTSHLKSHRKEYDFMCEVCGKEFVLRTGLTRHMKKHTGVKVTCNICNLKLRKSSLSRHLRLVHVPYAGIISRAVRGKSRGYKRITRSRPLRLVYRKGEDRKYYCKICKINFEKYKSIVEHNKEFHFDIKKWPCKLCTTEFSHKLNLRRHYRKKHNLNVIQAYKLVDENEDLDTVLAFKIEGLDKSPEVIASTKNISEIESKTNISTPTKSNLLPDEIYFKDEKIHSSTIQDEIMKAADNIEIQEINVDYMNDLFTDLFKEP